MIQTYRSAPNGSAWNRYWQPVRISLTVTLGILLGWRLLMGNSSLPEVRQFDLNTTEVMKFAASFGLAEASNDTHDKVLQLGSSATRLIPENLIAFEEHHSFVYALMSLNKTDPSSGEIDSPRLTRRLIFLKPSTFVLDDEIAASSPRSARRSARWLFHSRARPLVRSRSTSLAEDGHELTCETLFPETAVRQVSPELEGNNAAAGYVLQVTPKQPSKSIRFLHVVHIRRRDDPTSVARPQLFLKGSELHLTIDASPQSYKLSLPPADVGPGEIEISGNDTRSRLDRRFLPAGVLPHGRQGIRLLELWDGSYRGGKRPLWDAGLPSGELRRVVEEGIIRPGSAVDLGCGSGTDAIYLASKGFDVTAIDIAPTALSRAREKADRAGVKVRWLLANVLSLPRLKPFEFIFDRGCYHEVRFDNAAAYVETVRRLSQPARTRFLLLAGNPNEAPMQYAPPQVAEEDIRVDFSSLFDFEWLQETRFETSNPAARGPLAWSVMLRRKAQQ